MLDRETTLCCFAPELYDLNYIKIQSSENNIAIAKPPSSFMARGFTKIIGWTILSYVDALFNFAGIDVGLHHVNYRLSIPWTLFFYFTSTMV